MARDWHELNKGRWVEVHARDVIESLENNVFPKLGQLRIGDITPPQVLEILRIIEKRPALETAKRVRQRMSAIFVYGVATGVSSNDPAAIVKGAMAHQVKGRQPALIDLSKLKIILSAVESAKAHYETKLAHRLLALTSVRPGTLITTPWSEFANIDDDNPIWQISAARMKLAKSQKTDEGQDHLVPLSKQALEIIMA